MRCPKNLWAVMTAISVWGGGLFNACEEENYAPQPLITEMLEIHASLAQLQTCAEKITYAERYVDAHQKRLRRRRSDFDNFCRIPLESNIRCRSFLIHAGASIESELKPCRAEDVEGRMPKIYERLHDLTGAWFEPLSEGR